MPTITSAGNHVYKVFSTVPAIANAQETIAMLVLLLPAALYYFSASENVAIISNIKFSF